MNNDTQYANNAPTMPYKTRTTHYTGILSVKSVIQKYWKSYKETKTVELIRGDCKDDDDDRSQYH
jgi:hypothetical protein